MKLSVALAATVSVVAGMACAAPVAPADVQYGEYGEIEQSLTGVAGDPANGKVIMGNKSQGNCVSCHAATDLQEFPFHGEVGPNLDGVADRWNEAELRGIVANAKKTYEGTIMPAFYKTEGYIRPGNAYTGKAAEGDLDPLLSAQAIEDVVAYLMTLKEQ